MIKQNSPRPRRKRMSGKKGNVAKSKEVSNAFTLIGAVMCIFTMSDSLIKIKNIYSFSINNEF